MCEGGIVVAEADEMLAEVSPEPDAALELRDVTVGHEDVPVLENLNLRVRAGEFFVVLGSNGSGKSTLLRTAAGLLAPWSGRIILFDADVTGTETRQRDLALFFKGHGLFSQLTVAANVELNLRAAGLDRSTVVQRSRELLRLVRLADVGDKEVVQLSAGERQRANLARAMAIGRRLLLMHEPLAHMDPDLRLELGDAIREWQRSTGSTVVMTTRDSQDALRLADRIAILHRGVVEDVGSPYRVYTRPASLHAATSTGATNVVDGVTDESNSGGLSAVVSTALGRLNCTGSRLQSGERVHISIRPEEIDLHAEPVAGGLLGRLESRRFCGDHWVSKVRVGPETLDVLSFGNFGSGQLRPGEVVHVSIRADACWAIKNEAREV